MASSTASANNKLDGKVAIITGAASGIGACTAKLFASHGAKVIIADIKDELGIKLSEEIGGLYIHCDVSKEEQVVAAVDLALSSFGKLDIMFNNAGVVHAGREEQAFVPFTEIEAAVFDHISNVNIKGTLFGVKHAAKAMISTNTRGCILNTCSIAAVVAQRTYHSYTITKHAVLGITKTAASELCRHGIRVNCVSPAAVMTPLATSGYQVFWPSMSLEEADEQYLKNSELVGDKLGVEDIANAALFLCSQDAKYISGQNLVLDGSFTSTRPFSPFKNPHEA